MKKELKIDGYDFIIDSDGNIGRFTHLNKLNFQELTKYVNILNAVLDEMRSIMTDNDC